MLRNGKDGLASLTSPITFVKYLIRFSGMEKLVKCSLWHVALLAILLYLPIVHRRHLSIMYVLQEFHLNNLGLSLSGLKLIGYFFKQRGNSNLQTSH